jgi:hypothetical protein
MVEEARNRHGRSCAKGGPLEKSGFLGSDGFALGKYCSPFVMDALEAAIQSHVRTIAG